MGVLGESASSLLELLELLESASAAGCVGNGCSVAAEGWGALGAGASGSGLAGSPGKGNCSATEGFLVSEAGGVQGLAASLSDSQ